MRFLRRSATAEADSTADPAPRGGATTGSTVRLDKVGAGPGADGKIAGAKPVPGRKGKPTPKRRDAEGRKRGPAPTPPRTQREASKLARANRPSKEERRKLSAQRRTDAAHSRERMAAGDERYLLPRDRGPVRAHVRDLVDSRPHLMGLFMPLAIVVVLSLLFPDPRVQQYMSLFSLVAIGSMIIEGILLGRQVNRKVRAKFPNETINGLGTGWYTFTRASQLRRLRMPKPRVKRGATV